MMLRFSGCTALRQLASRPSRCLSTAQATSSAVADDLKLTAGSMESQDPEVFNMIEAEKVRERESILLSPACNYAPRSVLDTLQTVLQNKYSEGYPRARYYGGNENVDDAEELTQQRALALFHLDPAEWKCNVQPLGGYNALFEVFTALIAPSSRVMTPMHCAMSEDTSGVGRFFNVLKYDSSSLDSLATNYKPHLIVSGNGVDAPFNNGGGQWDYASIGRVAKEVNAYHLCDISDSAGLVAANLAPSPFASADAVVCSPFSTLRGPRGAAMIFYRSAFASNVDGAVFPGHQGGPHNHAISAMATSLRMAQSEEFRGYQERVRDNAQAMEGALRERGFSVLGNGGHCVAVRGLQNRDSFRGVADRVNMQML